MAAADPLGAQTGEQAASNSPPPGPREYQRAYKACIPCRKRKARCDLEPAGNARPPCARCRREHRECLFSAERNWKSSKRQSLDLETPTATDRNLAAANGQRRQSEGVAQPTYYHDPLPPLTQASRDGWHPGHSSRASLGDSVMRTVVSSGNDALNILFEAAHHQEEASAAAAKEGELPGPSPLLFTPGSSLTTPAVAQTQVTLSTVPPDILTLWKACRFVRQGWLSAEEAVTYMDLFFKNMCPLSPIITDFFSHHKNHLQLLTQEPTLCATILMISSRYHVLPGEGGTSRGFFIHDRLWRHCQHLIMRTIFGQEKRSNARTRAIGTIEALLLITEWHPRALHFPPESDGWDSDLILTESDVCDFPDPQDQPNATPSTSNRWLEDVIEPARRSDRMSWMLLGSAVTLAHELGIFDEEKQPSLSFGNHAGYPGAQWGKHRGVSEPPNLNDGNSDRRTRVRKLLYIFVNHLASRLGCLSLISQSLNQVVLAGTLPISGAAREWHSHMVSWIELTKLMKSVSDMFFPSQSFTRQLLHSGAYIGLLQQFIPLLEQWRRKHLDSHPYQGSYQETLFVEYHYARIYINSVGMQAVCERALTEMDTESDPDTTILRTSVDDAEYGFIQEVVDGSCQILRKVIALANTDSLRFWPVRLFLRITTASIILLKAISLGIRNAELQSSLDILDRSIQALRSSNLDDVHLAARYATLLDLHVTRLKHAFVVNSHKSRMTRMATRRSSPLDPQDNFQRTGTSALDAAIGCDIGTNGTNPQPLHELSADDWLTLPFDPTMAPFAPGGTVAFPGLEGNGLDFIWNLPLE